MAEPVYTNDPFEDTSWIYPETEFEKRFLRACGRTKYPSKELALKVKHIQRESNRKNPKFTFHYIEDWVRWAEKRNSHHTVITLPILVKTILKQDNIDQWRNRNQAKEKMQPSAGSYSDGIPEYPDE